MAQYKEAHTVIHGHLAFNITLAAIGAATSLYGYMTPFAKAKLLVGLGAGLYLSLNVIYYFWCKFLHTPTCFRGSPPKNASKIIWIGSNLSLPAANYQLFLINPATGKKQGPIKEWNIGSWIYADGQISNDGFAASMEDFARGIDRSD